jgi:hypothetical protein
MPFRYRWRRISPEQAAAIARAHRGGVAVGTLARLYDVAPRTIWRVIARQAEPTVTITIGFWQAPFVLSDEGPVQVGQWRPAS